MEDYQLLGQYLKEVREKKQLSLENMAEKTKLSMNKLRELESGYANSQLPALHTLKSYIKNYLSSIYEDPAHALNLLPKSKEELEVLAPKSLEKRPVTPGVIVGVVFVFLLISTGIYKYIVQLNRNNTGLSNATVEELAESSRGLKLTGKEVETTENDPYTEPESAPPISSQDTPSLIKPIETKPPMEAKNKISFIQPKTEDVIPNNIRQMHSEAMPANVYIYAYNGESYIRYKVDEDKVQTVLMRQYQNVLLKGKKVLLWASNAANLKIYLNELVWEQPEDIKVLQSIFPSGELITDQDLFERRGKYSWETSSAIDSDGINN